MPDPTPNASYITYSFIDLQLDLANYLNETATIDGNWDISEKKRQINHGLVQVAARTFEPVEFIEGNFSGTTAAPIGSMKPPSNMIKPVRLFVTEAPNVGTIVSSQDPNTSAREYIEVDEENFFRVRRGNHPSLGHIFWHDRAQKLIRFGQDIRVESLFEFYYVRVPTELKHDSDVSEVNPIYAHLAAMWAAGRLLYRDQEHRDKGVSLLRDFEAGIADFKETKFKEAGTKRTRMKLDRGVFRDSRNSVNHSKFSADDWWLRIDA